MAMVLLATRTRTGGRGGEDDELGMVAAVTLLAMMLASSLSLSLHLFPLRCLLGFHTKTTFFLTC